MSAASHDTTPPDETPSAALAKRFLELVAVVDRLRSPAGCPWDRKQTPQSMMPYLLEETYEVLESIESQDNQGLKEELGDLLLHILFQGRMAQDAGHFTLEESLQTITDKLIRRHPHVFGDQEAHDDKAINQSWETIKQQEKGRTSRLEGIPRALPALTRARRMQEKAASVGFDWPAIEPVWEKVAEELEELRQACHGNQSDAVAEEFGDLVFSLVNLGRFLKLDPEEALRKTLAKFEYRFQGIERELARRGRRLEDASLEEMDAIWNQFRQ
jgi:tetrapyrrole methylase family protein/MazG family protein